MSYYCTACGSDSIPCECPMQKEIRKVVAMTKRENAGVELNQDTKICPSCMIYFAPYAETPGCPKCNAHEFFVMRAGATGTNNPIRYILIGGELCLKN